MIDSADVVVVGAGAFGASVAWHLVRSTELRVAVLDKGEPVAQTTPRAAGLSSCVQPTSFLRRMATSSVTAIKRFEEETGASLDIRVPIRVAGIQIQVEIADEPEEHSRGLMFRESMEENHGMLFVYTTEQTRGFWMKNTLIPLDIAYADREGRIVDIQQMEPQVTDPHMSKAPMTYALEMNQGWFEANGVRVGDRIEF